MNNYIKATVPIGDEWTRPNNFPPIPVAEEQEVSMLLRLGSDSGTDFIFGFQTIGNDSEIYIDGTLFDTSLDGNKYIGYVNSNDYGFYHKGVKWCWIIIRPVAGQNMERVSIGQIPNPIAGYIDQEILEINLDIPYCNPYMPFSGPSLGTSEIQARFLVHLNFKSHGIITNGQYLFNSLESLEAVTGWETLTQDMISVNRMFQRPSKFSPRVFNFQSVSQMEAFAIYNPTFGNNYMVFNTSTSLSWLNTLCNTSNNIRGIEFTECIGVFRTPLLANAVNLRRAIFTNLKVDIQITNAIQMGEQAFLDLVDSLYDLTSEASSTMNLQGCTSYPSVIAAANAKNWTVVY